MLSNQNLVHFRREYLKNLTIAELQKIDDNRRFYLKIYVSVPVKIKVLKLFKITVPQVVKFDTVIALPDKEFIETPNNELLVTTFLIKSHLASICTLFPKIVRMFDLGEVIIDSKIYEINTKKIKQVKFLKTISSAENGN